MWWESALFISIVLIYGVVLTRYIPERLHLPVNMFASILAIMFGVASGLSLENMGLGLHFIIKGIAVTAACSFAVMIVAGLVALLLPAKRLAAVPEITRPGKIAYETAVRIPLSTALSEEILFRGVLLALLMQHSSTLIAVLVCSAVFGVWHASPGLRDYNKVALTPIIIATGIAGVFFCWLRILAGSIVAPWLIHWTINSSTFLAIHFIRKKVHDIN